MPDIDHILAILVRASEHLGGSLLNFLDTSSIFLLAVVGFLFTYVGQHFCTANRQLRLCRQIAVALLIPYFVYRYITVGSDDLGSLLATVIRTGLVAWVIFGALLLVVPFLWSVFDWIIRILRRIRRSYSKLNSSIVARRERRRLAEQRRLEAIEAEKNTPPPPPPSRSELLALATIHARQSFSGELDILFTTDPQQQPDNISRIISYSSFRMRYDAALRQAGASVQTNAVRNIHLETAFAAIARQPTAVLDVFRSDQPLCLDAWNQSNVEQKHSISRKVLLTHKQVAHRLPQWCDAEAVRLIVDCLVVPEAVSHGGVSHEPPIDALCTEFVEKLALGEDARRSYDEAASAIEAHYSREEFTADLGNCRLSESLQAYAEQCKALQAYIAKLQSTVSHDSDQALQHARAEYQAVLGRLDGCSDDERQEIWADICRKYLSDRSQDNLPPVPRLASVSGSSEAVQ